MALTYHEWWQAIKSNKKYLVLSLLLFTLAAILYGLSGNYVTEHSCSGSSQDLILNSIGPYNLSLIFIWFFLLVLTTFILYPLVYKPHEFHYFLNMFSLFIIVRSGFILFTRMCAPIGIIHITFPGFIQLLTFSNDFFFSGHTGLPFLGFLLFRKNKPLAYFMLYSSIILGITALVMHEHYSIDVLSAYFITYGIYAIGNYLFKKKII